ncbi:MAG: TraB/GumN family protein [Planctomycetota bacterium]
MLRLPRFTAWLLPAAFAALGAASATAQDALPRNNERPFFWRVDGEVPSYLFGTFHLPDERILALNPEVERALAAADAVFLELDFGEVKVPPLLAQMRMPAGRSWSDIMPAGLLERVERHMGATTSRAMQQFRPFVAAVPLLLKKHKLNGDPLDDVIYKDAKSAGKQVGGLETVAEQVAAFTALELADEVKILQCTLDQLEEYEARGLDLTEEMIKAYCAGDTKRVVDFFTAMNGTGAAWAQANRALLTDRNIRMAERIDQKLQAERSKRFVFAVGAGHLIGDTNIVDLLRARGYTVTRIPMTAANIDEEIEQLQREVEQRQARIRALQEARPKAKKAG